MARHKTRAPTRGAVISAARVLVVCSFSFPHAVSQLGLRKLVRKVQEWAPLYRELRSAFFILPSWSSPRARAGHTDSLLRLKNGLRTYSCCARSRARGLREVEHAAPSLQREVSPRASRLRGATSLRPSAIRAPTCSASIRPRCAGAQVADAHDPRGSRIDAVGRPGCPDRGCDV